MLILSRSPNQETFIKLEDGRVITLMVTEIKSDRVKIGFSAPRSIQIVRAEAGNQHQKLSLIPPE